MKKSKKFPWPKPNTHAQDMRSSMGKDRALKVALQCFKSSSPGEWNTLPLGNVFWYKRNEQWLVNNRELNNTNKFWEQVVIQLRKLN